MWKRRTREGFRVLALGGVTLSNARECIAGPVPQASRGIRLFQSGNVFETVRRLRG